MMMRFMDFSSWGGVLTTIGGLLLFTLIGMGIRVLMMLTIQQRQQRANRQINERLRTLMAAYKVLGGSFTGNLDVDPSHRGHPSSQPLPEDSPEVPDFVRERRIQIRDAVEAALSDILLLGTEDQVRMAARAATDMAEGRPIRTADLVASLREHVRQTLDLDPIPADLTLPAQGPTRPPFGGGGRGRADRGGDRAGERGPEGQARDGDGGGGGGGMGLMMGRRPDDG